jgi:type I restriction enzyme S subunit
MNSIQLHSVVEFVRNGATIKQDKNSSLGIPITRIETISNSVFNYDRLGYANVQDDTYSKYYLYDNDVLLSHINSEKFLGRSVLYKLDPAITPIIHGMNLLCIRFHKQVYNPAFFVWYTKSDIAKDYFKIHTKRAVNQASITSTAIKEMPIPDIKIEMQNAIVCELDKIQEALANKNEQLKKLDELIQSKFYEMFGDPIINEKGWEMKVLEKMGKIASGGTPSRNKSEYF